MKDALKDALKESKAAVSEPMQIGPFQVIVERRGTRMVFGRRRREGLRLSVERNGTLKVTAPLRVAMNVVAEFVLANTEWIETHQAKAHARLSKSPPKRFVDGERLRFFGEEKNLVIADSNLARPRIEVSDGFMIASMPQGERHADAIQTAIAKFYDQQARLHIPERVAHFSKRMGVAPSGLSFRRQKTRWGSCSSLGHISFNWKLVFAPEAVIDYLVVHELAHLVHANHSDKFWDLVKKNDPDCRAHRRWLRDHQLETEFLDAN
ncbi:SprT family zinc-dependent metalloprotease [soil metagenome]